MVAPSDALASTAAPMCNELAQSIEAPPTIWPFRGGSIRSVPSCPASSRLWQVDANSDRAERVPPLVLREAPVGPFAGYVSRPSAARLLIPDAPRLDLPVGHGVDVYRPPRA